MRSILRYFVGLAALVLTSLASAAIVVNPATGASGSGGWMTGPGSLITFDGYGGSQNTLQLTLAQPSTVDFFAGDCCIPGDAFEFLLDGNLVAWSSVVNPGGTPGNFSGTMDDLAIAAGVHTIQLRVANDCCGSGGMSWSISSATPTGQVPEPTSLALAALAVAGFVGSRRRRQ